MLRADGRVQNIMPQLIITGARKYFLKQGNKGDGAVAEGLVPLITNPEVVGSNTAQVRRCEILNLFPVPIKRQATTGTTQTDRV